MAELLSAYRPGVWIALLVAGVLIGLLGGRLGVGGVVAVPVLSEVFGHVGVAKGPAVALDVGTAQANILIASLTAASAH